MAPPARLAALLRLPLAAFDKINGCAVRADLHPADFATIQRLIET